MSNAQRSDMAMCQKLDFAQTFPGLSKSITYKDESFLVSYMTRTFDIDRLWRKALLYVPTRLSFRIKIHT